MLLEPINLAVYRASSSSLKKSTPCYRACADVLSPRRWTCMGCSALCCICCVWAASGDFCPARFPNGAQRTRTLPSGVSPTKTVSAFWSGLLKNQVGAARLKLGRSASATCLIVDAQSVKSTDTAAPKGYDAGKKISGIKRHIGVDTQGFPHAVAATTAEVTERKGALQALSRCKANLGKVQNVLADANRKTLYYVLK